MRMKRDLDVRVHENKQNPMVGWECHVKRSLLKYIRITTIDLERGIN